MLHFNVGFITVPGLHSKVSEKSSIFESVPAILNVDGQWTFDIITLSIFSAGIASQNVWK